MARLIEFSRRSTGQLLKILTFYDERNGSDNYSRHFLITVLSIRSSARKPLKIYQLK